MDNLIITNSKYSSREVDIREELSLEEVIKRIKNDYPFAEYDPKNKLGAWDQLLVCESLSEGTSTTQPFENNIVSNENVSVSEMYNGGCKSGVKFELNQGKKEVIARLKQCNADTSPFEVASLLEQLFKEWPSKPTHWIYVAQHWPPRRINCTIKEIIKTHTSGRLTIQNVAAFFTHLIKHRRKRKMFKKDDKITN